MRFRSPSTNRRRLAHDLPDGLRPLRHEAQRRDRHHQSKERSRNGGRVASPGGNHCLRTVPARERQCAFIDVEDRRLARAFRCGAAREMSVPQPMCPAAIHLREASGAGAPTPIRRRRSSARAACRTTRYSGVTARAAAARRTPAPSAARSTSSRVVPRPTDRRTAPAARAESRPSPPAHRSRRRARMTGRPTDAATTSPASPSNARPSRRKQDMQGIGRSVFVGR